MTDPHDPNDPLADIEPYDDGSLQPHRESPRPQTTAPGADAHQRPPLLTGLILGLLLVVVSIALFQLLADDGGEDQVASATTLAPGDTATTLAGGDATATTGAGGTDGGTGTDGNDTDGTVDLGDAAPYAAVGDPIPIEQLQLAADGVGEIEFGREASDAIGRLVASLGEPEEDTGIQVSDGAWGTCSGENERIVRWGPFAAIVVVDPDGTETFAAYRHDLSYGLTGPALDMATVSGLQSGSSFRQLEQIYAEFDVTREEDAALGPTWHLTSANTGNLLLWGPLSDEDIVRGIYSPDACGRF